VNYAVHEHSTVSRYFILTTFDNQLEKDKELLNKQVDKVRGIHGCDIILNGVYTTLKYFLRLIDTDLFIENYVKHLNKDNSIKYEHKLTWNELCSSLI